MTAYYNEIDPYAAQWLRNLIAAGHIAPGEVDTRSIVDVRPGDLRGFRQCHFFAGIGGWSLAARIAGWPDDRPLWTGSCPCQPFSVAGKGWGVADERHLWPEFFRLVRDCRPTVVGGEQVAAAVGKGWLDGVFADLEGVGYTCWAAVVPACAVDAPHRRDRLWFVADTGFDGRLERHDVAAPLGYGRQPAAASGGSALADANGALDARQPALGRQASGAPEGVAAGRSGSRPGPLVDASIERRSEGRPEHAVRGGRPAAAGASLSCGGLGDAGAPGLPLPEPEAVLGAGRRGEGRAVEQPGLASIWASAGWLVGADGKARRVEPCIRLLADGIPNRVGKLRAYGNAIVPQVAAEILGAYLEAERLRLIGGVFG